ncbi:MAG: hypothetical protein C4567_12395 [Deltaproteobacteria bacterium]|nr:MAG: hypothetical protein C4567_12395 [Deltaproteobacteria bacterium]
MSLIHVPQVKWGSGTGRQVILKSDFEKVEGAVVELADLVYCPDLVWVDATQVKIPATSDCKARLMLCGFPSPFHRGLFVDGGLSDGKYREMSADVVMDFDTPSNLWGNEKASQWYAVYALAAAADTTFTLKALPAMRFSSQVAQVITLRNCGNTGDIGYGFSTNELANYKLLVLSGASKGQIRTITANNNDNGTAGTLTYSGTALTLAQGDWLMVLPNTNFRYLGMILNDDSSNLVRFIKNGRQVAWNTFIEIASGAINGYAAKDLGLKVPPTARRLLGEAVATGGTDVKLGISYDGTNAAVVLHGAAPSGTFQSVRGAIPFACHLLDGNRIYFNNENTSNQSVRAVGWEE